MASYVRLKRAAQMDPGPAEVLSDGGASAGGIVKLQHRVSFFSLAQWSPEANVAELITVKGKQFNNVGGNAILNDAYFLSDSADAMDGTGQVWLDTSSSATTLNVEETLLAAEQGLAEILDTAGVPLSLRALHEAVLRHPTSARAFPSPISGLNALFAFRHFRNSSLIAHRLPRYSLAFLLLPQRDVLATTTAPAAASRRTKGATAALCDRWATAAASVIFRLCTADAAAAAAAAEAAAAAAAAAETTADTPAPADAPAPTNATDSAAVGPSAPTLFPHTAALGAAVFGPSAPPPLWRHPAAAALTNCASAFDEYAAVCPAAGPNVFADATAAFIALLPAGAAPAADWMSGPASVTGIDTGTDSMTADVAACLHDVFAVWGGSAQFRRSSPPPPARLILVPPTSAPRAVALASADALWRLLRTVAALAAQLAWAVHRQQEAVAFGVPSAQSVNSSSGAGVGAGLEGGGAVANAVPPVPLVSIAQCQPQGKVLVVDYTRTGD